MKEEGEGEELKEAETEDKSGTDEEIIIPRENRKEKEREMVQENQRSLSTQYRQINSGEVVLDKRRTRAPTRFDSD